MKPCLCGHGKSFHSTRAPHKRPCLITDCSCLKYRSIRPERGYTEDPMSLKLHCDRAGCAEETAPKNSRWWTVSTDEVIGGVGTTRRIALTFCSKRCLGDWANAVDNCEETSGAQEPTQRS